MAQEKALIIGAGAGLSASVARLFASEGMAVARSCSKCDSPTDLASETGAKAYAGDASRPGRCRGLVRCRRSRHRRTRCGRLPASARARGPIEVAHAVHERHPRVSGYGGFLVAQQAAKRMIPAGRGTMLFTGASASVKGFANSSSFAMGTARPARSLPIARTGTSTKGIHVAHFVIDGGIEAENDPRAAEADGGRRTLSHRPICTFIDNIAVPGPGS